MAGLAGVDVDPKGWRPTSNETLPHSHVLHISNNGDANAQLALLLDRVDAHHISRHRRRCCLDAPNNIISWRAACKCDAHVCNVTAQPRHASHEAWLRYGVR